MQCILKVPIVPSDILYVFRPKWEGGQYDGDEKHRLEALRLGMELGADYIDVEFQVQLLILQIC